MIAKDKEINADKIKDIVCISDVNFLFFKPNV